MSDCAVDRRDGTIGIVTSGRSQRVLPFVLAVLCAALTLPAGAAADDGDGRRDVRRTGTCTGSSHTTLRLRADDGTIRVELEIDTNQSGASWTVILLHERRTAYHGIVRTGRSGSFKLRYTVPDWFGTDSVVARATSPRRETCRVSAAV